MRWVYSAVALIFGAFAAVQYNDPDGLIWIAAYLYAAAVTIPPIRGRHTVFPLLGLVIYLVWAITLIGSVDAHWLEVEEARECLGLLIAALWMGVLLYGWVRQRKRESLPVE